MFITASTEKKLEKIGIIIREFNDVSDNCYDDYFKFLKGPDGKLDNGVYISFKQYLKLDTKNNKKYFELKKQVEFCKDSLCSIIKNVGLDLQHYLYFRGE